jgi:hypothetical protein
MCVKYTVTDSRFFLPSFFFSSPSSSCFVNSLTDRSLQSTLTFDCSKDVVWCKDVPFECPKRHTRRQGVQNLQNCSSSEISAKTKTSVNVE